MHLDAEFRLDRVRFKLDTAFSCRDHALGIFGPSGSGKSTLIHLLAGLIRPDQGRLVLNGRVLLDTEKKVHVPPHKRDIAVVFQEDRLLPHRSVLGNLQYAMKLRRGNGGEIPLDQAVEMLDLGPFLHERPRCLSGGQKQRVAIARALLSSPSLVIMDEPLCSLDEGAREAILPHLARLKESTDIDVIIVSHGLEEILTLTDRLLLMQNGSIHDYGHYADLALKAQNQEILRTARIVNLLNLVPEGCDADRGVCRYRLDTNACSPVYPNEPVVLKGPFCEGREAVRASLQPADISLALGPVEYISIQNQFRGVVRDIIDTPEKTFCRVDIGVDLLVDVTHCAARDLHLRPGKNVWALFKAQSLRLFAGGGKSPLKSAFRTKKAGFTGRIFEGNPVSEHRF